jgi:phospholipid-binding lipoprotein MlaA
MIGKKILGTFLITGALLAGAAWAEGTPDGGLGLPDSGQVTGRNEMTVRSEVSLSGPVDVAESEKETVSSTEAASKTESTPEAETVPRPEPVPKEETTSATETVPTVVTAPKTEAAPAAETGAKTEIAPEEAEPEEAVEEVTIADPIEPWNRAMFQFNDKLYFWVLKPVARGYNVVVPEPVRISVRNFFRNVTMPIRFVSSLLQGKFKGAGTELARFGINTTIGLAGFFDVAKSKFDLNAQNEDLGQTLGFYGMGGLMYIVWPFLGPSNVRDTIGFAGDVFLDPVNYISPWEAVFGVHAYKQINKTSLEIGTYEDMKKSAIEPYIAMRDAYIQYRKGQIKK